MASPLVVHIKHAKATHKDVAIDTSKPPLAFKETLEALTGVPVARQKLIIKGKPLADDDDWSKLKLKANQTLMLMGSAEAIPVAPTTETVFVEDLPEEEQEGALTGNKFTAGLANLGNTCYMNATLQCLRTVAPLRRMLDAYDPQDSPSHPHHRLTVAAKGLMAEISRRTSKSFSPYLFLNVLREAFPTFAQQGQGGVYSQQDAEECWTQLLYALKTRLGAGMEDVFSIGTRTELTCTGAEDEKVIDEATNYVLKCNITSQVNHLHEGLKVALKEDREKHSATLGADALFTGTAKITKLPRYLTVQMMRFNTKRNDQGEFVKQKILRSVSFPMTLDVFELCDEKYQESLADPREALRKREEREAGVPSSSDGDAVMEDAAAAAAPSRVTGQYELVAVLTHKGRSSDAGHYVGWVRYGCDDDDVAATAAAAAAEGSSDADRAAKKAKKDDPEWVKFDDDTISAVTADEVLRLHGGGDWHIGYLFLYRAKLG